MDTPQFLIEDMDVHLHGKEFRCEATPIYQGEEDEKVLRYAARVFVGDDLANRGAVSFHDNADDAITAGLAWVKHEGGK